MASHHLHQIFRSKSEVLCERYCRLICEIETATIILVERQGNTPKQVFTHFFPGDEQMREIRPYRECELNNNNNYYTRIYMSSMLLSLGSCDNRTLKKRQFTIFFAHIAENTNMFPLGTMGRTMKNVTSASRSFLTSL